MGYQQEPANPPQVNRSPAQCWNVCQIITSMYQQQETPKADKGYGYVSLGSTPNSPRTRACPSFGTTAIAQTQAEEGAPDGEDADSEGLTKTREPLCTGCGDTNPSGSNTTPHSVSVEWIQCDPCSAWWHEGCGGVTAADYEGERVWVCPRCPPPSSHSSQTDQTQSLSLSMLESIPTQECKQRVGESLFPLISSLHPGDIAGKITNILLNHHKPPPRIPLISASTRSG